MPGRPAGAVADKLFSGFSETGGGTTLRRFSVEGARSVVVIWKADSGTPTMSIGFYVHPKATRETVAANLGMASLQQGASVVAGQNNYIYTSAAAGEVVTPACEVPLGIVEMDVSAAGNVGNLDVKYIILY